MTRQEREWLRELKRIEAMDRRELAAARAQDESARVVKLKPGRVRSLGEVHRLVRE